MNLSALLRQFSIRMRMIGAIGVVLVLLLIVGSVGLFGMNSMRTQTQQFMDISVASGKLVTRMVAAQGDVRRYEKDMIIGYEKPETVKQRRAQWDEARKSVESLGRELAAISPAEDRVVIDRFKTAMDSYAEQASKVINQLESGGYDNAAVADRLLDAAKQRAGEAEKLLADLRGKLDEEAQEAKAHAETTRSRVLWIFVLVLAVAALIVVPLTLLNMVSICNPLAEAEALATAIAGGDLSRHIKDIEGRDEASKLMQSLQRMQEVLQGLVGELRSSADSIRTASAEIATGNQDLSGRTEQTASNLQQAASSLTQLTGTVKQTADSARTANQLASSASGAAAKGGEVVSHVVSTMDEINTSSKRIGDIIGVIDGIAFQTNILALNAAVEAARAGEQGRGFAVVAGEVRSLAQRSAEAAREIKTLIGASVERVETGARLVQEAGSTMSDIVSSVQRVNDIIGEITAAASEQSDGITNVNQSVAQLDQMTQQNAALVEESAAAAESLRDQAERLASVVGRFRIREGASAAIQARPVVKAPAAIAPAPAVRATPVKTAAAAPRPAAAPKRPAPATSAASPAPLKPAPSKPAANPVAEGEWESF